MTFVVYEKKKEFISHFLRYTNFYCSCKVCIIYKEAWAAWYFLATNKQQALQLDFRIVGQLCPQLIEKIFIPSVRHFN